MLLLLLLMCAGLLTWKLDKHITAADVNDYFVAGGKDWQVDEDKLAALGE